MGVYRWGLHSEMIKMANSWSKIIFSFFGLLLIAVIIDSCVDIAEKMQSDYEDRTQTIELSSHGPDISHCLLPENDTWDCIRNGEYRKQMFRADI